MRRGILPLLLATALPGLAQPVLSLREAAARQGPDFHPAHEGEEATVRGTVAGSPVRVLDYVHLAIVDDTGYGLVLEAVPDGFTQLSAGDRVEAKGLISRRGGMPVLQVAEVRKLGSTDAPQPVTLPLGEASSFARLGRLVSVRGRVVSAGENAGGTYVELEDGGGSTKLFLPRESRRGGPDLLGFRAGDEVSARGIASQYTNVRPFDRGFQVLVGDASAVRLLNRRGGFDARILLGVLALIALIALLWGVRERRMSVQRRATRTLYTLSEEIMAASSPMEILRRLLARLSRLGHASGARIYVYRPFAQRLERVPSTVDPEPASIALDSTAGSVSAACAVCFRNRTLLAIPEIRRSPFAAAAEEEMPSAAMFAPMFSQEEAMGVLEIDYSISGRRFSMDEKAAAQHLANQIGTALKLIEQHSLQEQLHHSEKLAAAGELISGVADRLRAPLARIAERAESLASEHPTGPAAEPLGEIADEARKAAGIVVELLQCTQPEQTAPGHVVVSDMLARLAQHRTAEGRNRGLEVRYFPSADPLVVLGVPGQLEHVFLSLIVHAEFELADALVRTIDILSTPLGQRAVIEIEWAVGRDDNPLSGEKLSLCPGILHSHGGSLRYSRDASGSARFQIDLPRLPAESGAAAAAREGSTPEMTMLVLEPEERVRQRLVSMLSARGHRVVPVANFEEALDLTERLRFNFVFCSTQPPMATWVEFFRTVRARADGFVLLTDSDDHEVARAFQGEAHLLPRQFDGPQFDDLLRDAEAHAGQAFRHPRGFSPSPAG
ncbi:MAG: GAF domain-containing protein [Bryobacteraceae bacterium]